VQWKQRRKTVLKTDAAHNAGAQKGKGAAILDYALGKPTERMEGVGRAANRRRRKLAVLLLFC
jgi:hypothetical protein